MEGFPTSRRVPTGKGALLGFILPLFFIGCAGDGASPAPADPLLPYLPTLAPTGGVQTARAGRLTADNFTKERVAGAASQGLIGDYFMANDVIRVVVQQPGRTISPLPYGGNIIDMDFVKDPVGDQLGEVGLFMMTGRTGGFTDAEIVRDGSEGGPAVLRFRGADIRNDYIEIEALGPLAALFSDRLSAENQLDLKLAVTYVLSPGASRVDVYYSFYNPTSLEVDTNWGTITDSGARVWNYAPGLGFADLSVQDLLSGNVPPTEYLGQQGDGISLGVIPDLQGPGVGAVVLPITGVAISVYDLTKKQDLFNDASLTVSLPPGGGAMRQIHVALGRGGLDSIERIVRRELRQQPLRQVTGTITGTVAGETLHIGVSKVGSGGATTPYTALIVTGSDGQTQFTTELPPGPYSLQAEGMSHRLGDPVLLTTPTADDAATVQLAVPPPAQLSYRVVDVDGTPIAAKITIVGAMPPVLPAVVQISEHSLPGVVAVHHSLSGDSTKNDRWDHPIAVAPGTYRVVISHGPEWSRYEQKLTLKPGDKLQLSATLERVVDTSGYLACDFHQHSINSPDSMALLEERVINNLDEGVEFVSSSDHDYITDYRPTIAALGVNGQMDSIPGEELTPFGYGHFISWPLPVDANSPNGGAFDWGGGELPDIAPRSIFEATRKQGARIVQVNHPRLDAPGLLDFQQNFDRAALHFDFARRTFYGDKNAMKLTAAELGLAADAEVFADNFDTLEIGNGNSIDPPDRDGERHNLIFERVLRDFMNFVSFGFTPVATGNSDTHGIVEPAGVPRTLVRVPDDSRKALLAGVSDAIIDALLGHAGPRDAIVSNGPFLQLAAGSGGGRVGIGGTARPDGDKLHIEADVTMPDWMAITTVEVFANSTFTSPEPMTPEPMIPTICFTTAATPSERCRSAPINGALTIETRTTAHGGKYLHAHVAVDAPVATLLAGNRPGASGQDVWLMARCFGDQAMFPVEPHGLRDDIDLAKLLDGARPTDQGVFPLAITNPLFVDVDGGGYRAPFQP